jgi:hypothetical protein
MKSSKSQMALEFVLLLGFLIIMMTIVIILVFQVNRDKIEEKIDIKMRDFAITVQNEIIYASEMNYGYNREFKLPVKVENTEYEITVQNNNKINLNYNNKTYYYKIPEVNGDFITGTNKIIKTESEILLNPG